MLKLFILLFTFFCLGSFFNLDENFGVWEFSNPDKSSYFGFQVFLHKALTPRLLISAPRFEGSKAEGMLFNCQVDEKNLCSKLNTEKFADSPKKNRENQWLGMSLTGDSESVLTCAPLWHVNTTSFTSGKIEYSTKSFGRCSLLNKNLDSVQYSFAPCEQEVTSNMYHGYCEAGFSSIAASTSKSPFYVTGAPGSFKGRGAIIALGTAKPVKFISNEELEDDSSYMGYAVSWGNVTFVTNLGDVVVGAPRANNLTGKVFVYSIHITQNFIVRDSFSSPEKKVGEYFGATVCVVDMNNDGKGDLFVASPFYSVVGDEGRVYFYINKNGVLTHSKTLAPTSIIGARFGSAIGKVGDLNNDGYQDIAIGAPMDGIDGRGAVYIFNGGAQGISLVPNQIIMGSKFLPAGQTGFGSSISNGLDVDINSYPDIAVGAYSSGKSFLIRTRPIITLSDDLKTNVSIIPLNVADSNCQGPDGKKYYCVEFKTNLKYKGNVTKFDVELQMEIEKNFKNKRGWFFENGIFKSSLSKNVTLTKDVALPLSIVIYITITGEFDINTPITINANYINYDNPSGCGIELCPIVDIFGTTSNSLQLVYKKECGSDDICEIDLVVSARLVLLGVAQQEEILYGSVYQMKLEAWVINLGEIAYQPNIKFTFSPDLQIDAIQQNGIAVTWEKALNKKEASSLIQSALKPNEKINIDVKFTLPLSHPSSDSYIFTTEASANGIDVKPENNKFVINRPAKTETCVRVQGNVEPALVLYNTNAQQPPAKNADITDIGAEVKFNFFVQNSGVFAVNNLTADIDLVVQKGSLDLIYVVNMTIDGKECEPKLANLNPRNFLINSPKKGPKRMRRSSYLNCENAKCSKFTCNILNIEKGHSMNILIVTRVWEANFVKLQVPATDINTTISVKFIPGLNDRNVQKENCLMSNTVKLAVKLYNPPQKKPMPWWIILVAILVALFLLAIAIVLLKKAGFFKRKRQNVEENEPLKTQADDSDIKG